MSTSRTLGSALFLSKASTMGAEPRLIAMTRTGISTLFFTLASAPWASRAVTALRSLLATAFTSGTVSVSTVSTTILSSWLPGSRFGFFPSMRICQTSTPNCFLGRFLSHPTISPSSR